MESGSSTLSPEVQETPLASESPVEPIAADVPAAPVVVEIPAPPKAPPIPERRISERFACDGFAEVIVSYSGFLFRGEIVDLSEFGCYIKTRARLTIRRSAEAELRFTINSDRFSVLARTAAVRPGQGVGFEFTSIEPATHQCLVELIEELKAARPRQANGS